MRKFSEREKTLNYRFDHIYITAHNGKKSETIKISNDTILGGDIYVLSNGETIVYTPIFVAIDNLENLFKIKNIKTLDIKINDIKYSTTYSVKDIDFDSAFKEVKLYPQNKCIDRHLDLTFI